MKRMLRSIAFAAAYIAVVAYTSMTVGLLGGFSYFMQQVVAGLGLAVHWAWFAASF